MELIKKLEKRSWILSNGKNKTATFGLFKCIICNNTKEVSLSLGNSSNTCGNRECINELRNQNQLKTFNSIIGKNGNYKKSPFYRTFQRLYDGIKQRCYNPKHKRYTNYGKKGITISNEWLNFNTFVEDMFPEYEKLKNNSKELKTSPSIDRKNPNKGYSKENCEWIKFGENSSKDKKIPIIRMDFENNILERYDSMTEAVKKFPYVQFGAMQINTSISQIHNCCNHKSKHHVGYRWEFATNKEKMQINMI